MANIPAGGIPIANIPTEVADQPDWYGYTWPGGKQPPDYFTLIETEASFQALSPGEPAAVEPAPGNGADLASVLAAAPVAGWHGIAFRHNGTRYPEQFRVRDGYLIWTKRQATTEQQLKVRVALGLLSEEDMRLALAAVATTEQERQAALTGTTAQTGTAARHEPIILPIDFQTLPQGGGNLPILDLPTVGQCTHLANSYRIRHYYHGTIWYALGVGWIMWTGKFWRPDQTNDCSIATGFVDGLSRKIAAESSALAKFASEELDSERRTLIIKQAESLMKWAIQTEHEKVISAGLKLSKHALLIEYAALNTNPMLFNCQNGTINLLTGELRPHDSADLITFISPVNYDPVATCPVFERFLSEVFAGDAEMVAFIKRAMGWSLTGVVKERALFFLHGNTGKNGKTTLIETIMKLTGISGESSYGYGRKVGADTFMRAKNSEDNQRKAATLAGPRFICTSEVDEDHRLNEQLVKDITGGDTLEGRRLYQEAFTFRPAFKPWMYGNHKPNIRGTDDAIWSRVKLIPFDVSFNGREDLDLPAKLEAELPGILNWAIRGCLDWQRGGLRPPAKVQAATQAYRDEMDVFGPFIAECCVVHPSAAVRASELYSAYKAWCSENGTHELSQTKFGKYLTSKGFVTEKSSIARRLGIGLKSEESETF